MVDARQSLFNGSINTPGVFNRFTLQSSVRSARYIARPVRSVPTVVFSRGRRFLELLREGVAAGGAGRANAGSGAIGQGSGRSTGRVEDQGPGERRRPRSGFQGRFGSGVYRVRGRLSEAGLSVPTGPARRGDTGNSSALGGRKMRSKFALSLAAIVAAVGAFGSASAMAQVTVDGSASDAAYGTPLFTQNISTNFGDSNLGQQAYANGSELDAIYATVANGNLYITLAGNLESNFNKFELFFDTVAGGQNRLRGNNPDVDFNGLNRLGDDGSGNGLTFDSGFAADFYLTFGGGGGPYRLFANYATLPTDGGGAGGYLGDPTDGGGLFTSSNGVANGISYAINNSNTAGVGSGTGASSGAGVLTGLEIAIPLSVIGNPSGDIKLVAFVNGSGHDFLANQVSGGLPAGTGNLGDPRNVNFANIAGNQFVTVSQGAIPEPTGLVAVGAAGMLLRRSRRAVAR